MPAACALRAISVSALPSKGRMTSAFDLLVDQGLDLADLLVDVVAAFDGLQGHVAVLGRLVLRVGRDGGDPAVVRGGGREADGDGFAGGLAAAGRGGGGGRRAVVDDAALLLVHAVRAAPAPRAPAPKSRPRRPSMGESDEGDMVDLFRWVVCDLCPLIVIISSE